MKVLYNNCYGGFCFSDAFLAEYKTRTGQTIENYKTIFRRGRQSIRCDPVAIAIVEEKGSEWASGSHSSIAIHEFPAVFDRYWEIEECEDGDEGIHFNISDAFADILHTFMETRDLPALESQYAAIMDAKKSMAYLSC